MDIVERKSEIESFPRLTYLVLDDIRVYAPPWGLSTLAKEFSAATRIMQSSSKELSTL